MSAEVPQENPERYKYPVGLSAGRIVQLPALAYPGRIPGSPSDTYIPIRRAYTLGNVTSRIGQEPSAANYLLKHPEELSVLAAADPRHWKGVGLTEEKVRLNLLNMIKRRLAAELAWEDSGQLGVPPTEIFGYDPLLIPPQIPRPESMAAIRRQDSMRIVQGMLVLPKTYHF